MKRSKRLQPIVRLAGFKAQQSAAAMAWVKEKLQSEEEKLQQLETYQAEYRQTLVSQSMDGMMAQKLKQYSEFTRQVDLAIGQQREQITAVESQLAQVTEHWRVLNAKHKGLEKLLERIRREESHVQDRLEQTEQDDRQLARR